MHEHDMNWVRQAVSIAAETTLQARRSMFLDTFTACQFAFGGGEGAEVRFQNYIYSLMTSDELDYMEEAERLETLRIKERFVAQVMEHYKAGVMSGSTNAGMGGAVDQQKAMLEHKGNT